MEANTVHIASSLVFYQQLAHAVGIMYTCRTHTDIKLQQECRICTYYVYHMAVILCWQLPLNCGDM